MGRLLGKKDFAILILDESCVCREFLWIFDGSCINCWLRSTEILGPSRPRHTNTSLATNLKNSSLVC